MEMTTYEWLTTQATPDEKQSLRQQADEMSSPKADVGWSIIDVAERNLRTLGRRVR